MALSLPGGCPVDAARRPDLQAVRADIARKRRLSTSQLTGLVDTGADAVLASNLLTVDLADNEGESQHAVGGRTLTARYKTIAMRLHPGDGVQDVYLEWPVRVGFVEDWHSDGLVLLGSVGFLDRFTVTASRFAQAVAIEERDAFDERFGVVGAG